MRVTFFPLTDSGLLAWSLNYSTRLSADPGAYGISAEQAAEYAAVHSAFATALLACDPAIRCKTAVVAKNQARANLKHLAKRLSYAIKSSGPSNAQKVELGLNVRAAPTPSPVPLAPVLEVKSVRGSTVAIRLRDAQSAARRGRPPRTNGASIFSFVGAEAPSHLSAWKFVCHSGRTSVAVTFDSTLAPGTRVFLTAGWFNGKKQSGAMCNAVAATLSGGAVAMAA